MVPASDRTLTSLIPCLSPSPRIWGATKARPDQARHSGILGRRRVSTDLILGAPALPGAHHAILRGFSSSCLSIEAQVREVQLDWFLRNPAGALAGPSLHIERLFMVMPID